MHMHSTGCFVSLYSPSNIRFVLRQNCEIECRYEVGVRYTNTMSSPWKCITEEDNITTIKLYDTYQTFRGNHPQLYIHSHGLCVGITLTLFIVMPLMVKDYCIHIIVYTYVEKSPVSANLTFHLNMTRNFGDILLMLDHNFNSRKCA